MLSNAKPYLPTILKFAASLTAMIGGVAFAPVCLRVTESQSLNLSRLVVFVFLVIAVAILQFVGKRHFRLVILSTVLTGLLTVMSIYKYLSDQAALTVIYSDTTMVAGTEEQMNEVAKQQKALIELQEKRSLTRDEIVQYAGGKISTLWSDGTVHNNFERLSWVYSCSILFLGLTLMLAVQGFELKRSRDEK